LAMKIASSFFVGQSEPTPTNAPIIGHKTILC